MLGIRATNAPWSLDLLNKSDTVVLFPLFENVSNALRISTICECRQIEAAGGKLS